MFMKSYLRMLGKSNVLSIFLRNKRRDYSQESKGVPVKAKRITHLKPTYSIFENRSNIIYEAQKNIECLLFDQLLKLQPIENVDKLHFFLTEKSDESKQLHKLIDDVILDNYERIEMWGLIVLLFSKAATRFTAGNGYTEKSADIWKSQQQLAIITQLILTCNMLHENVKYIKKDVHSECNNETRERNKIAILVGDYFMSEYFLKAAHLKNADILQELSNTLKGMSEVEFMRLRNERQILLPPLPLKNRTDYAVREWVQIHTLSTANLLGTACRCALIVAESDNQSQTQAYQFGKHFALAFQACTDLAHLTRNNETNSFNLFSAPVLFHIEHDPSILTEIYKCHSTNDNINYSKILETVQSGPAIQLTKQLRKDHAQQAMILLSVFSENEATIALSNIIAAVVECVRTHGDPGDFV